MFESFSHFSPHSKVEQLCFDIINKVVTKGVGGAKQLPQEIELLYDFIVQCMMSVVNGEDFCVDKGNPVLAYRLWDNVGRLFIQFLLKCNVSI